MVFSTDFIVIDGVKIYIQDVNKYLAESYLLLYNSNKSNEYKLLHFSKYEGERQQYVNKLLEAYLCNYNNINEILGGIKEYITVDDILKLNLNRNDNFQITLKDFWYLKRDWSYLQEGEQQIKIIVESIKKELTNYSLTNSLFLGCGAGRLVVEFYDLFDKIYATDKSFSMLWHINKLLTSETYEFYNPNHKNVFRIEDVARKYSAFINETNRIKIIEKIDFFVSDVLNLPFKDNSLDSIFSIYFTDVIALKLWFPKINSILKSKGLFIHFGPLDYFFSDEIEMLTAEEFRMFFEKNNYKTIVDKVVETPHLKDDSSISYQVYRNWLFIAEKQK
jgi:carnosine N-methyltransferase